MNHTSLLYIALCTIVCTKLTEGFSTPPNLWLRPKTCGNVSSLRSSSISPDELDAISELARKDPSFLASFLTSKMDQMPASTIQTLRLAAKGEFANGLTHDQQRDLEIVGRILVDLMVPTKDGSEPSSWYDSSSESNYEEEASNETSSPPTTTTEPLSEMELDAISGLANVDPTSLFDYLRRKLSIMPENTIQSLRLAGEGEFPPNVTVQQQKDLELVGRAVLVIMDGESSSGKQDKTTLNLDADSNKSQSLEESSSDPRLAELQSLSTEELNAISNIAQQDSASISTILIDSLPQMPENTLLALELAFEGKFSPELSDSQKRDLETLGKALAVIIQNSQPTSSSSSSGIESPPLSTPAAVPEQLIESKVETSPTVSTPTTGAEASSDEETIQPLDELDAIISNIETAEKDVELASSLGSQFTKQEVGDSDSQLAGLLPLSVEELDAISGLAQQDSASLSVFLQESLPQMPENTILALQLASEGKFSPNVSEDQKRDLETLGKTLAVIIKNANLISSNISDDNLSEELATPLSSEELSAISSIAQQDPEALCSFLASQLNQIPSKTIGILKSAANNDFPTYATYQQQNELRTVGRALLQVLDPAFTNSRPSIADNSPGMTNKEEPFVHEEQDIPSTSADEKDDEPIEASTTKSTESSSSTMSSTTTREVATSKDHIGVGLLNMLLRTDDESKRAETLRYYLFPSYIGESNYALVKPFEFLEAIQIAVEQIQATPESLESEEAQQNCLQIAIEARLAIVQGYGEDSDELKQFEEGLRPVFV